jgi:hypothetical protein
MTRSARKKNATVEETSPGATEDITIHLSSLAKGRSAKRQAPAGSR